MKLNFSHITKTAGSSIEDCAFENQIQWGRNNFDFWKMIANESNIDVIDPWHIPISFCKNKSIKTEILSKYIFFTVVRNPYERCISEYFCVWNIDKQNMDINSYIYKKLKYIQNMEIKYNAHFIPQHFYVYENKNQYTNHVIYYENIKKSFDNLMKKYNLNIQLNKKINVSKKTFDIKNLTKETIDLIQKTYESDFVKFGYSFNIKYSKSRNIIFP